MKTLKLEDGKNWNFDFQAGDSKKSEYMAWNNETPEDEYFIITIVYDKEESEESLIKVHESKVDYQYSNGLITSVKNTPDYIVDAVISIIEESEA